MRARERWCSAPARADQPLACALSYAPPAGGAPTIPDGCRDWLSDQLQAAATGILGLPHGQETVTERGGPQVQLTFARGDRGQRHHRLRCDRRRKQPQQTNSGAQRSPPGASGGCTRGSPIHLLPPTTVRYAKASVAQATSGCYGFCRLEPGEQRVLGGVFWGGMRTVGSVFRVWSVCSVSLSCPCGWELGGETTGCESVTWREPTECSHRVRPGPRIITLDDVRQPWCWQTLRGRR